MKRFHRAKQKQFVVWWKIAWSQRWKWSTDFVTGGQEIKLSILVESWFCLVFILSFSSYFFAFITSPIFFFFLLVKIVLRKLLRIIMKTHFSRESALLRQLLNPKQPSDPPPPPYVFFSPKRKRQLAMISVQFLFVFPLCWRENTNQNSYQSETLPYDPPCAASLYTISQLACNYLIILVVSTFFKTLHSFPYRTRYTASQNLGRSSIIIYSQNFPP